MSIKKEKLLNFFMPVSIGIIAFLLIIGQRVLIVSNIAWIVDGDPLQHFLGWHFFRHTAWTFPIGLNPRYGLELSNSIVFSDSNPLLAFIFKPFSTYLPEVFQYFGLWLLACFILQAWFAWKLVGLASQNIALRALATGLFIFSPPMLMRMQGHLSLSAHFLILAALYLSWRPRLNRSTFPWVALLTVAALVHAYLFVMVAAFWIVDLIRKEKGEKLPWKGILAEVGVMLVVVGFFSWQAGYFSVGKSIKSEGFGFYRMNLLSPFDSNDWSLIFRDIVGGPGDYEGFNYLGAGVIFLLICTFAILLSGRIAVGKVIIRHRFMFLLLMAFSLFSLSNNIGVGALNIHYPIGEGLERLAATFRSSGRMFWPVFYVTIFFVVICIIRNNSQSDAVALLSIALALQIFDLSRIWGDMRRTHMVQPSSGFINSLHDPFWKIAAQKYRNLRWLVPENPSPKWNVLASYAAHSFLGTDAIYLARVNSNELEKARRDALAMLDSGNFNRDSLYVLDDKILMNAGAAINRKEDLLAKIDGFNVVAPGWKLCKSCPSIPTEISPSGFSSPIKVGQKISTVKGGNGGQFMAYGWGKAEEWGTWSVEDRAEIIIPVDLPISKMEIEAQAFVVPGHTKQRVQIGLGAAGSYEFVLEKSEGNKIVINIPASLDQKIRKNGMLVLRFSFKDAISPKDLDVNDDGRKLAVGIKSIMLY